jgi:Na+/H+ antiporter NhaD/arsenite permease-like protein
MTEAPFVPSAGWVMPFALLLGTMAVVPLVAAQFWESNLRKLGISVALALPVFGLYLTHNRDALVHAGHDYVSFIVLLGSLFVISGGILVTGDVKATPGVNAAFLAAGGLIANVIGTTGASMLLIRPLLSTNQQRKGVVHTVVFFIFIVSNAGGCLTPLGDPPLFLGYLRGVPFSWTLRLWPQWLLMNALLLLVYYLWDRRAYGREAPSAVTRDSARIEPLRVTGMANGLFLLGVVASVAWLSSPIREIAMAVLAGAAFLTTPARLREANRFSFHAILEVAALFLGIFVTMLPALDLLHTRGASLGLREPWEFFWATGLLSSVLDNAPTYLAMLALAQSLGLTAEVAGVTHELLVAISAGAVFMGANTYIGNGPNFMVRAIAEERGVKMPSFGGYMVYSGAVLIPCFVIVTVVFFR